MDECMMSIVMDLANAWRNAHIEIVLWQVTPGLASLATQPHPNEGKNSLPCWKRPEPTPKPTLGQPVHLPASNLLIPAPHPGVPHVLPKAGFSPTPPCPAALA